ncbi:hypothetical protein, partial [Anoxybacillus sp. LAT27]|uniref:hypothetical protein n=1 Tax=Anoxybacillus sp. LAT27 TaxID=2878409 RepID=UPI001EDA1BD1
PKPQEVDQVTIPSITWYRFKLPQIRKKEKKKKFTRKVNFFLTPHFFNTLKDEESLILHIF